MPELPFNDDVLPMTFNDETQNSASLPRLTRPDSPTIRFMKSSLLPYFAALALLLTSCETIVDVPAPAHTPRLALSYTLSNQAATADYRAFFGSRDLYVSTSQGVFETKDIKGRADAAVELRDAAGQVVEQFRARARPYYNGTDSLRGYYVPTRGYVGQPGQRYTLRASAPGVEPVEATLTLPAPATVAAASYVAKTQSPNSNYYQGRLTFTVPDQAATTDYYLAYARVLDAQGQLWGRVNPDNSGRTTDGPNVSLNRFDLSDAYGYYRVFPLSDAGRNGQPLTASQEVSFYYSGAYGPQVAPLPAFIEVVVSTITPEAYSFYLSLQRYYDIDGNPFAEPAPLRSNVTGGYGLFGGAADVTFRIPL